MSEFAEAEFTGERVIPELVDADLLNEHLARYRFANRLAAGMDRAPQVLDAGCGSGYGSAELSCAASVTAADISADAIGYARLRFARPHVRFVQAACEALPFSTAAFDLVTAFEVIEHTDRWQELLAEANRVLKPSGILLVSTPNRDYYEESRGDAGPNPFHRHEFSYEEFRQSLGAVFPHVRLWTQNHAEAIVFSPQDGAIAVVEASGASDPLHAHFYFASCSQSSIATQETFVWLPSNANLLRERERHIAKLNGELAKKDAWLRQTLDEHSELQRRHEDLKAELEQRNHWATELNLDVKKRDARIGELQDEQERRLTWISDLESQIARARTEIERLNAESAVLENTVVERTKWAQRLDAELTESRQELQRLTGSKWVRAGAKLGIGPHLRDGQ